MGVAGRATSGCMQCVPVAYMILNEILIAILDTYRENATFKSQSVGLAHARPMMPRDCFDSTKQRT